MTPPPAALVRGLVEGPSLLAVLEWHEEIDSTMRRARELADAGCAQGTAVAADVQTAGRGRRGRTWSAPAGSSLLVSLVLRPQVPRARLPLLPLLAGLALAESAQPHAPAADVGLKWPNDLLVDGAKAAGVLVDAVDGDAVVLGLGVDVDWRGVARDASLAGATSLAEAAGGAVDRWRLFAGFVGVFGNRYARWCAQPTAFLDDYRARCRTIGTGVRVTRPGPGAPLDGVAHGIDADGALLVRTADGALHPVHAGDVEHVRPA